MSYSDCAKADELYNKKQYKEAFRLYMDASDTNNFAQYRIGWMYRAGEGVEQNSEESVKWLTKASENQSVPANVILGFNYLNGKDVDQDYKKALRHFLFAAEKKDACAVYNLGHFYRNGWKVEQDLRKMFVLYNEAAQKNWVPAQFMVGLCYDQGLGTEQNGRYAFSWYIKAANQEHIPAMVYASEYYLFGITVDRNIDKALNYLTKAHELGQEKKIQDLGDLKIDNNIFNLGELDSERRIGEAYLQKAKKDPKYYSDAIDWLTKSVQKGNVRAGYRLGMLYFNGIEGVVEKDENKGFEYIKEAADNKDVKAQYYLGKLYYEGKKVPKSPQLAILNWINAAKQNDHLASVSLREIFGIDTY